MMTLLSALWAIIIILVGVLPLSDFVGHSHWEFVHWLPTADQLQSKAILLDLLLDFAGNLLLFVPLGIFLTLHRQPLPRTLYVRAILMAFLLSSSVELYQVFCHSRFTSLMDVFSNVSGTTLGLAVARYTTYAQKLTKAFTV